MFFRPCSVPILRHIKSIPYAQHTSSHDGNFVLPRNSFAEAGYICAYLDDRFLSSSAESLAVPTQMVDHTNHLAYCTNLEIVKA